MMFVDFGNNTSFPLGYSASSHPIVWRTHELLCIGRLNGDILKCIGQKYKPQLTYDEYEELSWENTNGQSFRSTWNFPEWSNHPYLAVVCVDVERVWKGAKKDIFDPTPMPGEHIYLINLKNESVLPLLSINDTTRISKTVLKWPWFWSSIPQTFSEQPDWCTGTKMPDVKQKENSITLKGNKVRSIKPISQVIVCDLNGRCIWKRSFSKSAKSVFIPENIIQNKMVIVRVEINRCFWSEFCSINAQ
jgi:hypothetical protein